MKVIQNRSLKLSVDARGRLVGLVNRATGTELITCQDAAEGWRLVLPSGRHTLYLLTAAGQSPAAVTVQKSDGVQTLTISYEHLDTGQERLSVTARFCYELTGDEPVLRAWAEIHNQSAVPVDEVEFPAIGGLGGFRGTGGGREVRLLRIGGFWGFGAFGGDILNHPLPHTGREADQYCREHETAMWEDGRQGASGFDFYGAREGLYVGYNTEAPQDFVLKVERYPKGVPHGDAHAYPPGTPKWLRLWGVHVAQVAPGAAWRSAPVTLYLHQGDWHTAATWYARTCFPSCTFAEPPRWMADFVGWTEIVGNLYTGEVFHDFPTCARKVVADHAVTGLNLLFYYGHTNLGAEGADFDQSPARAMGGEAGFADMLRQLHDHGIRVMLLDHFHRYVNRDVPEYQALGLERYALRAADGSLVESRWWKETVLSCRRLAGPTPVWVEMCPGCPEWEGFYREHVRRMIARGVDGLELDCFGTGTCYSREHGHAPGQDMLPAKLAVMRRVREEAKRLNPDFLFVFETMYPPTREVADAWYPNRYTDENGPIQRFMLPQLWQQAVRVGNYAYDSVNKAVTLGIGVETEIWGLRRTTLEGCPELARYIGQVNALRRQYGDVLIRGTFRDTLGASVKSAVDAPVLFSVLDGGTAGKALVLRNPSPQRVQGTAVLRQVRGRRLVLVRPGRPARAVRQQPLPIALGPYGLAVLLALPVGPRG